ncbi:MAG TPA: glycosyltransferase family 4 protein [Flavobacteriaceae bacterium]|nr:glycosyltransferase family 4 protein [Flavobacteriaceae bacterium]
MARRVLQLIDSLEPGGAERMAVQLANLWADEFGESYLCASRAEGTLKGSIKPQVKYLFLKKKRTLDLNALIRLRRFIKEQKIEVIHAHSSSYFMATLCKLSYPRVLVVWHDHFGNSQFLKQRPKNALRVCSLFFKSIISVNQLLKTWSIQNLWCKQVFFVPNFVAKHPEISRTQLKGEKGKRILCLANLRPQKDHSNLLQAFQMVLKTHPDWTLHLVGTNFNDAYAADVKGYIEQHNLEKSVFMYGSCQDVQHIISQCEIGVLSSQSEGLPLALLEYGLGKLAVVGTNVGDCKQVIPNQEHGMLVASKNPEALAIAIIDYIQDTALRAKVSNKLSAIVNTNFTAKAVINILKEVYSV